MKHRSFAVDLVKRSISTSFAEAMMSSQDYMRLVVAEQKRLGAYWTLTNMMLGATIYGVVLVMAFRQYHLWWVQIALGAIWLWHITESWAKSDVLSESVK
jgi:hypothetical protein